MENITIFIYIILSLIFVSEIILTVIFYKKFMKQEKVILELNEEIKASKEKQVKEISEIKSEIIDSQVKTNESFEKLFAYLEKKDQEIENNVVNLTDSIILLKNEVNDIKNDRKLQESILESNSNLKEIVISLNARNTLEKKQLEDRKNQLTEVVKYDQLSNFSDKSLDNARVSINKLEAEVDLQKELNLMKNDSDKEQMIKDFLIKAELKNLKDNKN